MSGRDDEFLAFAQASAPRLQQAAYLMCRDWHLAQDLTQATLTRVYLAWSRIGRAGADRYAYARTVLIRQFLDHRRLRSSSETATGVAPEQIDAVRATAPDDPTTRLTVLAALALLPVRDRAILVLRYWEDQSVAVTAQTLSISAELVRTRSLRALAVLREHLGADLSHLRT
jgi:RNA polymerase sigma factor (sigma-70 family)